MRQKIRPSSEGKCKQMEALKEVRLRRSPRLAKVTERETKVCKDKTKCVVISPATSSTRERATHNEGEGTSIVHVEPLI